jgi:hypothetical protein
MGQGGSSRAARAACKARSRCAPGSHGRRPISPNGYAAIKATLLSLLTNGMLLVEQTDEIGIFRTKTIVHLRIATSFAWETIKGLPHNSPPPKPSCFAPWSVFAGASIITPGRTIMQRRQR